MNESDLFLAFNELDDVCLNTPQDAAIKKLHQRIISKCLAIAACITLLLSGAYGFYSAVNARANIVYPDQNKMVSYTSSPIENMLSGDPITYSEIIQDATAIVVADVLSDYDAMPESYYGAKRANVIVREVLKGNINIGDALVVCDNAWRTKNGDFGTSDGGLLLETGNRVLLFLRYNEHAAPDGLDQPRYTIGGYQKYFLDRDGKFYLSASYGDHYMSQYYLKTHIEYAPKTIEEYRELIRSVESAQIVLPEIVYPGENEKIEYENGPLIG